MPKGRGSPIRFNYTDQIPGYDTGDNPLGDITPRPRPPQDTPPQDPPADVPIDPGLGGGDGSGSPSGVDPEDVPPAPAPPDDVPIDAGLGGGDGSGSSSGVGPANDFTPHPMYNPETGAPYGVEGLGMSTLIVDWLVRFGRVNATAAPFAPAQTHYARPPCLPDEDPWSTETSAGTVRWCAKYCPDGARCPTDVPAGVTARPSSGLVSGKPYCMLDCGVDGECDVAGGGACLVSGPGSGVCVYQQ